MGFRRCLVRSGIPTLALVCGFFACAPVPPARDLYVFEGQTMGTTYTVKVVAAELRESGQREVQARIEAELSNIDEKMSHYRDDSELSRFNRWRSTAPFQLSEDTFTVLEAAQGISALSGGAFDITVAPLVNAWGFGPEGRPARWPSEEEVARLAADIGYAKVQLDPLARTVRKTRPNLTCDLSAIAPGYAVDRVAEALERSGMTRYMVELGGEVRTGGLNDAGQPWRIAIERPISRVAPLTGIREVERIVPLVDRALATSGDYRNFYEVDGNRFSHTINPRTGRPVTHRLASVSVIHERCMLADAIATALHVLGPEDGYQLAERQGWRALFVVRGQDGSLVERSTSAFDRLTSR